MLRTAAALALSALLLASCSSGAGPRPHDGTATWEQTVARATAARAEDLAALGETERALATAEQALLAAREAHDPRAEARALALLGRLSGSSTSVARAAELARELGDADMARLTDLLLAEQLLAEGDAPGALALGDALLQGHESVLEDQQQALAAMLAGAHFEARVQHLRSRALRSLERWNEMDLAARRARLALSLVPDDELLELRYAVDMDVAQGHVIGGRLDVAFGLHAKAALHAREAGNRLGECLALRWMARDLAGMGRDRDAVTHLERAYDVARELGDVPLSRSLAKEGLSLLHSLDEPLDSPRFARFRAALLEER